MTELRVQVQRTRRDIVSAIAANVIRSPGTLAWYAVGSLAVAGISVAVNRDRPPEQIALVAAIVFTGMLLLYSLIVGFSIAVAARKTWSVEGAFDPISYTFSDEGLNAVAAVGQGVSQWSMWPFAFETKSLIVIRHQFNLIQIVPKRGLTVNELASLREILRRNVKKVRLETAP